MAFASASSKRRLYPKHSCTVTSVCGQTRAASALEKRARQHCCGCFHPRSLRGSTRLTHAVISPCFHPVARPVPLQHLSAFSPPDPRVQAICPRPTLTVQVAPTPPHPTPLPCPRPCRPCSVCPCPRSVVAAWFRGCGGARAAGGARHLPCIQLLNDKARGLLRCQPGLSFACTQALQPLARSVRPGKAQT